MKNNKKLIIIIVILVIIFSIIHINNINNYKITKKEQKKINILADKLVIKDMITYFQQDFDNYYEYKNIKIKNFLDEFNCNKNNNLICKKDNIIFKIDIEDSLLTKYKKSNYKNINTREIINTNNIKDDLGLMSLIKSKKNYSSLLHTKYTLKETYSIEKFALDNIKDFKSLALISGKYNGYIYTLNDNEKELVFTIKEKNYIFNFKNLDYFTDDLIKEIASSIIIEGE